MNPSAFLDTIFSNSATRAPGTKRAGHRYLSENGAGQKTFLEAGTKREFKRSLRQIRRLARPYARKSWHRS